MAIALSDHNANLLYINNRNGSFAQKAKEYGIADTRMIMNAIRGGQK